MDDSQIRLKMMIVFTLLKHNQTATAMKASIVMALINLTITTNPVIPINYYPCYG